MVAPYTSRTLLSQWNVSFVSAAHLSPVVLKHHEAGLWVSGAGAGGDGAPAGPTRGPSRVQPAQPAHAGPGERRVKGRRKNSTDERRSSSKRRVRGDRRQREMREGRRRGEEVDEEVVEEERGGGGGEGGRRGRKGEGKWI